MYKNKGSVYTEPLLIFIKKYDIIYIENKKKGIYKNE